MALVTMVTGWVLLLAVPAIAGACSIGQRADVAAAMRSVAAMRAAGSAGGADAAEVLGRARRSCADARFARAVAAATQRLGVPAAGRRARVVGLDLVGATVDGVAAWRLDTVRLAARVSSTRNARRAAALRTQLLAAGAGSAAITWSDDATRTRWDAERQSAVAAALARSPHLVDRRLAGASARAFAPLGRQRALVRLGVLQHLRVANRVAQAASRSALAAAGTVARSVAVRAHVRVRAARARGWSRIDGTWSSAAQHRMLVAQAGALVQRVPHASTAVVVAALRRTLTSAPTIDFDSLPSGSFYPWPRDGAFDTQSVTFEVDKPASLALAIYGADDTVLRTLALDAEPGTVTITWDGNGHDGATLGAGEYRYTVDAADRLDNRVRVPGLDQFTIARDTTPPTVRSAAARYVVASGSGRIVAGWDVDEVHSPQVRSWLLLTMGASTVSIDLHASLQRATVRRVQPLGRGSWKATFVFADGSGNRTSHAAGTLVVR